MDLLFDILVAALAIAGTIAALAFAAFICVFIWFMLAFVRDVNNNL